MSVLAKPSYAAVCDRCGEGPKHPEFGGLCWSFDVPGALSWVDELTGAVA